MIAVSYKKSHRRRRRNRPFSFSTLNRVTHVNEWLTGTHTYFEYDGRGNIILIDEPGYPMYFSYDDFDRVTQTTYKNSGGAFITEYFSYDGSGRLFGRRAKNQWGFESPSYYAYDASGKIVGVQSYDTLQVSYLQAKSVPVYADPRGNYPIEGNCGLGSYYDQYGGKYDLAANSMGESISGNVVDVVMGGMIQPKYEASPHVSFTPAGKVVLANWGVYPDGTVLCGERDVFCSGNDGSEEEEIPLEDIIKEAEMMQDDNEGMSPEQAKDKMKALIEIIKLIDKYFTINAQRASNPTTLDDVVNQWKQNRKRIKTVSDRFLKDISLRFPDTINPSRVNQFMSDEAIATYVNVIHKVCPENRGALRDALRKHGKTITGIANLALQTTIDSLFAFSGSRWCMDFYRKTLMMQSRCNGDGASSQECGSLCRSIDECGENCAQDIESGTAKSGGLTTSISAITGKQFRDRVVSPVYKKCLEASRRLQLKEKKEAE